MRVLLLISFVCALGLSFFESAMAMTLDARYADQPLSLVVLNDEQFIGVTVSGQLFTQSRILSVDPIRIHKFSIGDLSFYISDRGYIEAPDDTTAVSIYLALG